MALVLSSKICRRCKLEKDVGDFYRRASSSDGLGSWCKLCVNDANAASRQKNPLTSHNRRVYNLRRNYGMTLQEYENLLEVQDFKCAICFAEESGHGKTSNLLPDHDHETGTIRGLLCHPCNSALGLLKDNPLILTSAIKYLERN